MVNNAAVVVGVEAMAAAQGMEFDRSLKSSPLIEAQFAAIRQRVAFWSKTATWPRTLTPCASGHCRPIGPHRCAPAAQPTPDRLPL